MSAGLHRKLTLVSAPAGFGKTACTSEWVNALDCPVTWLSLDPADDDPGRVLAYLVAAPQKVDTNLGREADVAVLEDKTEGWIVGLQLILALAVVYPARRMGRMMAAEALGYE